MKRGPRGNLDAERIKAATHRLLTDGGTPAAVSLRMIAADLGVAPNALYTYFRDLGELWHTLADEALGRLSPLDLLPADCPRCAIRTLADRARELFAEPGIIALLHHQPVLGHHSFELSETLMTLCRGGRIDPRDGHDLIMGWFYGSAALVAEGWEAGTDQLRAQSVDADRFPLIHGRSDANIGAQIGAILDGIGLTCRCRAQD